MKWKPFINNSYGNDGVCANDFFYFVNYMSNINNVGAEDLFFGVHA